MSKYRIVILTIIILVIASTMAYAKVASYTVTDTYIFHIGDTVPSNAFVNINIGNINACSYAKGNVNIEPTLYELVPDYKIKSEDDLYGNYDYGNQILTFNKYAFIGRENEDFVINIVKKVQTTDDVDGFADSKIIYSERELQDYIQPDNRIESNDPLIIAKAQELAQGCETSLEIVQKLFEFVNMYITYDTSDAYRNKGALSALQNGRGVCEEYSTLFVALCRALNIPARVITGYNADILEKNVEIDSRKVYHAWPEIYVDEVGWVPCEVTAEYYFDGTKQPYLKGFLQLPDPSLYVVEGVYDYKINEIQWNNSIELLNYEKTITLDDITYFEDVNKHWARTYVEDLYDFNIINGYEDKTFKPNNQVTRIEFICMLSRMLEHLNMYYYEITDLYYPIDFEENWSKSDYDSLMKHLAFYAQDTQNGAGSKTINYVFGENLNMNAPILREEVVALLAPFLKQPTDGILNDQEINPEIGFKVLCENKDMLLTDIENSKFVNEIITSYNNNVIVGYEDNTFRPTQTITRAEVATIFDRLIKWEI